MAKKKREHRADSSFRFDAALSFDGIDRETARRIAKAIKRAGLACFIDDEHQADLWGKSETEFERIYGPDSRVVIPLVSKEYVNNIWTRHEFELARREAEKRDHVYILPVRIDDTPLLGLPEGTIYQTIDENSPEKIAELLKQKIEQIFGEVEGAKTGMLTILTREIRCLPHGSAVRSALFEPQGKSVLTISDRSYIRDQRPSGQLISQGSIAQVWPIDGGEPRRVLEPKSPISFANISPDGERVVAVCRDGKVWIANTDGSNQPVRLRVTAQLRPAKFSPDGESVIVIAKQTVSKFHSDGSGQPVTFHHRTEVHRAEFSPSGEWIVTAKADGKAFVWRADGSGEPITLDWSRPSLNSSQPNYASFSDSGTRILVRSSTATIWSFDTEDLFVRLRKSTRECLTANHRRRYLGETASEAAEAYRRCMESRY